MEKLTSETLNRLSVEEFSKSEKIPVVVVLDNVRSLSNIGSIFRSCDAFAVKELYLCGICGTPPSKEINKTALGATESVKWQYFDSTIEAVEKLKENNYFIICVEQVKQSVFLNNFKIDTDQKYALVFGNEVFGVEQNVLDNCDCAVELPQKGTKHSINVAVCAGIVIWEFFNSFLED